MNYSRVTIVQVSNLREKLQEIGIKRDKVTTASIVAIEIYPSTKLEMIQNAES